MSRRLTVADGVRQQLKNIEYSLESPLSYVRAQSALKQLAGKGADLVEKSITDIQSYLERAQKASEEAEARADTIADLALEKGLDSRASAFFNQAELHRKAAQTWLWISAGLALLTAVVIAGIAFAQLQGHLRIEASDVSGSIQLVTTKILIVSILYLVTIWSSRNYRSHQHLYVANQHRVNALKTFEVFAESLSDEVLDTVLIKMSDAVFSGGTTGFHPSEAEDKTTASFLNVLTGEMGKSQ